MNLAVFLDRPCVVGYRRRERGKGDGMTEDGLTGTEPSCRKDPLSRIRRKEREARRVCERNVGMSYKSCVNFFFFDCLFSLRLSVF